ncbi:hypothetical protein MXB_1602, partial [Myxobolus squamalis]
MADDIIKICQNRGCGKKYREIDNSEEACCFHPDPPSFRDLLKIWSCCNEKSRNFSDFMNIPVLFVGCKKAPHSDVVAPSPSPMLSEAIVQKEISNILRPIIIREYIEDQSSLTSLAIIPTEDLIKELSKIDSSENVNENGHGRSSEITIGTKCLNNGCDRVSFVLRTIRNSSIQMQNTRHALKSDTCCYDYFSMGNIISINLFAKLIHFEESSVLANKTK